MTYRIDTQALHEFVDRQVALVEETPMPPDLAKAEAIADNLSDDELQAVWLGAGLATQLGLPILDEPERWIRPSADPGA